jgi:hypothetical protein
MRVSELIEKLKNLQADYGDVKIVVTDCADGCTNEVISASFDDVFEEVNIYF